MTDRIECMTTIIPVDNFECQDQDDGFEEEADS